MRKLGSFENISLNPALAGKNGEKEEEIFANFRAG